MSEFVGADPSGLDTLASHFNQTAHTLDQLRAQLGSHLHNVRWTGHDADHARHNWDSYGNRAMLDTIGLLGVQATRLQAQARQQRAASDSDGDRDGLARIRDAGKIPIRHVQAPPEHHSPFSAFGHAVHHLEHSADNWKKDVSGAAQHVERNASNWTHDAQQGYDKAINAIGNEEYKIVSSPLFDEVVQASHGLATGLADVAPFVALIPGGQGVAAGLLVVATVAQVVYLGGTALEMANGVKPWSASTLISGTADLVVDAAGAGEASLTAHTMATVNKGREAENLVRDVTEEQKVTELGKVLAGPFPGISRDSVHAANIAMHYTPGAVGDVRAAVDLGHHHPGQALVDGMSGVGDVVLPHVPDVYGDVAKYAEPVISTAHDAFNERGEILPQVFPNTEED